MSFFSLINRFSIREWLLIDSIAMVASLTIFGFIAIQPAYRSVFVASNNTVIKTIARSVSISPTPLPVMPTPTPEPVTVPVFMSIPKINLLTNVVEIGFDQKTNELEVPHDDKQVGWYKYGTVPGKAGTAILSGHYDTPTGAPAIFYNLKKLAIGDEISIITNVYENNAQQDNQSQLRYQVKEIIKIPIASTHYKSKIYDSGDASQITLLTCAGIWNPETKNYSHRLAVIAQLVDSKPVSLALNSLAVTPEQQVIELFPVEKRQSAENTLVKPYLRVESIQDKINIYMAAGQEKVGAIDLTLRIDPELSIKDGKNTLFTNQFNVHGVEVGENNLVRITLFNTDKNTLVVTGADELLLAQIPFDSAEKQMGKVKIINDNQYQPIILSPLIAGKDLREGKNILKTAIVK